MLQHFFHLGRAYFELDHRQAKAYLWLLFFTAVVICSPLFTYYLYPAPYDADDIRLILEERTEKESVLVAADQYKRSVVLFQKQIGSMREEDWVAAGLPAYLSKRILKYQKKIKPIKHIKDLYAIYGMDSFHVEQVKPYLLEGKVLVSRRSHNKQEPTLSIVDINTADSATLEALPAIGAVLSKRILKYRELLKGYVSKKQYAEIYGISPEALTALQKWTEIRVIPVVGNIKTVDYQKLSGHFYLSGKDARFILTQLKAKATCWKELQHGLEPKAQEHVEELELYYPCE